MKISLVYNNLLVIIPAFVLFINCTTDSRNIHCTIPKADLGTIVAMTVLVDRINEKHDSAFSKELKAKVKDNLIRQLGFSDSAEFYINMDSGFYALCSQSKKLNSDDILSGFENMAKSKFSNYS
jgi:hypothetical protein